MLASLRYATATVNSDARCARSFRFGSGLYCAAGLLLARLPIVQGGMYYFAVWRLSLSVVCRRL